MSEEKKIEGANAASGVVSESELEAVSGGEGVSSCGCFFTTDGEKKMEGRYTYLKCKSNCSLGLCACYREKHCVDKWHWVDPDLKLLPSLFANHKDKPKSNNYNT